ncbi:MAG: arsenite methyltransferase [Dehalococcoidia bacterium]|jgi:SAM-dependent methyltransferase
MTTRTGDQIREEVAQSYGARVRPVLEADDLPLPMVAEAGCCTPAPAAASCCGPAADEASNSCCGTDDSSEVQVTRIAEMYRDADIADLPATVTDVAFGCGNPTAISELRAGETVLDLGSGGGIDCFLAAKMVGETGRVIGVDMTPEMIALANRNLAKVGATNVEFRHGQIEALPVGEDTVDAIISNCVINLSPDKDQVFREAFRVLKPGGRLQVSDIVWTRPVPHGIKDDMEQWAGCISGALEETDYLEKVRGAGFVDVVSVAAEYAGGRGIASASVTARKPG